MVRKTFPAYSIRDTTYCKYSFENAAPLTTDRFKHNNFSINVVSEGLTSLYVVWIPKNTPWGNRVKVKKI